MKVCYVDESGNLDSDPCLVMAGILVDAARLNRTRQEFGEIFDAVQRLFAEPLKELKSSKMVYGKDRWRHINPEDRKAIAEYFCNWIAERKHTLLLSAINRAKFSEKPGQCPGELESDIWIATGFHIALQLQKANQGQAKNKGHTFLVFDENKQKADRLSELLWEPPPWSDGYYSRGKKQLPLDQLIDTAFTVKSHHAGLVQVADLFAFLLRRYAELAEYGKAEEWKGETVFVKRCIERLSSRMLPRGTRWPVRTTGDCAKWYNRIAPESLKNLRG